MKLKNTHRALLISIAAIVAVGVGLTITWHMRQGQGSTARFLAVPVTRGDVLAEINATGTVEPEEVVDVGAQVAGQINAFGTDVNGKTIDYGSVVDRGTVLAQIDDSLYTADVEQTQADLHSAEAGVSQAQAKLGQARQDWDRAQKLGPSEALAPSAYDQYKASFEIARANLAAAQAAVVQAQAALDRAKRNLGYCTIKSPVKGVIIDRRVNIGQTVVASLNAPSLFLIAKDLKRIQVWVSVNEADIGSIHAGQPVTFTVDAFPGQKFNGRVGKVRLNAAMTQNVVTYTVVVDTDNADGKLLPYLTANVRFITGQRQNVLTVPNAALRWVPRADQVVPGSGQDLPSPGEAKSAETIWVEQGNMVRPLKVNAGLTDGSRTEVDGAGLSEGMKVVVGQTARASGGDDGGPSPFAPPPRPHH